MEKIKTLLAFVLLLPIFLWVFLWVSFFIPGGYLLIPLVIVGVLYFYTKHSQIKTVSEDIDTRESQKEISLASSFVRALLTTLLVVITAAIVIFLFEKFKPARTAFISSYYETTEAIVLLVSAYFIYRVRK